MEGIRCLPYGQIFSQDHLIPTTDHQTYVLYLWLHEVTQWTCDTEITPFHRYRTKKKKKKKKQDSKGLII